MTHNLYIAPILPFYIFICHSSNLRWLWKKLAYLCTELCCRISLTFLTYFSKLFCIVSVLIFLSTWFSANLWGFHVHYMKRVLLLSEQTQAKSFCSWNCFMLHTLIMSNFWRKISWNNVKLPLQSNLFTLPVVLIFLYSLLPWNCFWFETWPINSFVSVL